MTDRRPPYGMTEYQQARCVDCGSLRPTYELDFMPEGPLCRHVCEPVPMLLAALRRARAELDLWGYGDHHYGEQPRDPGVLAALADIDRVLEAAESGRSGGSDV